MWRDLPATFAVSFAARKMAETGQGGATGHSPPLRGRCPAGQRGVSRGHDSGTPANTSSRPYGVPGGSIAGGAARPSRASRQIVKMPAPMTIAAPRIMLAVITSPNTKTPIRQTSTDWI